MTTRTRLARTPASVAENHPLNTREKRTAVNYALRGKAIPAKACSVCWIIKATSSLSGALS